MMFWKIKRNAEEMAALHFYGSPGMENTLHLLIHWKLWSYSNLILRVASGWVSCFVSFYFYSLQTSFPTCDTKVLDDPLDGETLEISNISLCCQSFICLCCCICDRMYFIEYSVHCLEREYEIEALKAIFCAAVLCKISYCSQIQQSPTFKKPFYKKIRP